MNALCDFYKSSIGKKVVVAVTGGLLILFLVGHVAGNLKAFAGYEQGVHKLDHYAEFLREIGSDVLGHSGFLWGTRVGLLICFILHIVTVIQLRAQNIKARPLDYERSNPHAVTTAASTMFVGGTILFLFVVYHILHMTTGTLHFSGFREGAVYANAYRAFQNPIVTVIYVGSMVVLGFHLFHGTWSLFQTLGLDNPDRNSLLRKLASGLAVVVALGFVTVPLAMMFGILPPPLN